MKSQTMKMWKPGACLALLGNLLLCLVRDGHGQPWVCSTERSVMTSESLHSDERPKGNILSFNQEPMLLQHPCIEHNPEEKYPALYLGQKVFLSLDGFESSLLPLTIPQSLVAAPAVVSSAVFVHKTRLLMVINQKVFIYFFEWEAWLEAKGIGSPINTISNSHCCYDPDKYACNRTSSIALAFNRGHSGTRFELLVSVNGGYNFLTFRDTVQSDATLLNAYYFTTFAKLGILYNRTTTNNINAYFQYIDMVYKYSQEGLSFAINPLEGELLYSLYAPGLVGYVVFWNKNSLQWSINHGLTVETITPIFTRGYPHVQLPPPAEGIRTVTATSNEIAILTKYNLFYGSLDMFSKEVVHIADTNITNTAEVIMFEKKGTLCIMHPITNNLSHFYNFYKCEINIQETLMTVQPPLQPCPVEILESLFHHKMYYMDIRKTLEFDVIFVPKPGTGSFPYVTANNPYIMEFKAQLSQEDFTFDGNMKYILKLALSQGQENLTLLQNIKFGGLSTLSVDVYNKGLFCVDLHPLNTLIALDCPPTKTIRLFSNATACRDGLYTEYVLQSNFTYSVNKDAYDPQFLGRKDLNQSNRNVSYTYNELGCPMLLYYDSPWLPILELWEDDKFVEYVPADFVLFEVNGLHTYDYLLTETEANCLSEAQNWTKLLNVTDGDPNSVWTRANYKSCKEYKGTDSAPSLTNKYQVLNLNEKNRIVFEQYNGIYIFKVIVVDPFYSYCDLTAVFSVYVHGALPHSQINPVKTVISFLVLIFGSILIVYYFPKLLKENAKMKSAWS